MFQSNPFEEDIEKATHENNIGEDWSQIMLICDSAINYSDGAKFCLKAIMRRLHHHVPRVVLSALTVLDACVKNCDRRFLLQVASSEFTTEVRKLLSKMHPTAATELKAMLQRWSVEEFKVDPELCIIPALYYKLKSEGLEFPQIEKEKKSTSKVCTDPDAVTSQEEENDIIKALEISLKDTGKYAPPPEFGSHDPISEIKSTSLPEPFKTRALYDFDAAEDNELTIKAGEIVMVVDDSNSSWWKGSNHRGEGLFPANFVTKDLEAPIDEEQATAETVPEPEDVSFVGEVKLDEKKIEIVLNWLNDVDPTEDLPDPNDMLRLENEVYQMGPLIEESLQAIDNRIAKLSNVNVKIMEAFDMFHDLSDSWSPMASMKYMPIHIPQTNLSNLPSVPAHPSQVMAHPMMYVPTSAPFVRYPPIQQNPPPVHSQASHALDQKPEHKGHANQSTESTVVPQNVYPADNQVGQPEASGNPKQVMVTTSATYMQHPMPYPFQDLPNTQQQGYIQSTGVPPNMISMPYIVPPMGSYVPFPYYYVNSGSTPANTTQEQNLQPTSSLNQYTTSVPPTPSNAANTSTDSSTTGVPVPSGYSNDLQQLTYSSSSTAQNVTQVQSQNPSKEVSQVTTEAVGVLK